MAKLIPGVLVFLSLVGLFDFTSEVSLASSLSQNDVSILIPLPKAGDLNQMLEPSSLGRFGELLPRKTFDRLPDIHSQGADATYAQLKVVSIRVDPCFPLVPPATGCQPQIRLIWQPVEAMNDGNTRALDAAVHTFYNLDRAEFDSIIHQLEAFKTASGSTANDEALTVHPGLAKSGLRSAYAKNFFKILLSEVGAERMSRITFTQLGGGDNVWTFGGFDIKNGAFTPITIARINAVSQTFANGVLDFGAPPNYFQGSVAPAPQGKDTFNLLIRDTTVIAPSDKNEIGESTMSAVRVENPRNHNAHTADCVSCHTAQTARLSATYLFPWLWLGLRADEFVFKSKFNLTNTSPNPQKTTVVRGFGYDGINPAISQRVINETAAVLEVLK